MFKINVEVTATKPSSIAGLHTNTLLCVQKKNILGVDVEVKKNYLMRTPNPMAIGAKQIIDLDDFTVRVSEPYDVVDEATGAVKTVQSTTISPKVTAEA